MPLNTPCTAVVHAVIGCAWSQAHVPSFDACHVLFHSIRMRSRTSCANAVTIRARVCAQLCLVCWLVVQTCLLTCLDQDANLHTFIMLSVQPCSLRQLCKFTQPPLICTSPPPSTSNFFNRQGVCSASTRLKPSGTQHQLAGRTCTYAHGRAIVCVQT